MDRETLGRKYNNPLCVKQGGKYPWMGSTGKDARGHAKFESVAWGLRAGIYILASYWLEHGITTIAAALARWAPGDDTVGSLEGAAANDSQEYARFVQVKTGLKPTYGVALFARDGAVARKNTIRLLLRGMAHWESWMELSVEEVDEAFRLYAAHPFKP